MLQWRLKAFRHWASLEQSHAEPKWANIHYGPIDYQNIVYYSAPKQKPGLKSLSELTLRFCVLMRSLGFRSPSRSCLPAWRSTRCSTAFRLPPRSRRSSGTGIVFCSFSEAVEKYPELIKKYLGTVVPHTDNFFAALNAAVFSDGSFVYVPKGVRCPMELSTYFRINAAETGQFERTLIVADEGSYVSYLEGCTAPIRDENQLHAAVVELVALTTPRSSTRRCRTGIPATNRVAAESITS